MRRILRTILLAGGFALAAQPALAKEVLHKWPVTDTQGSATILTAQGSASGRGLTVTIAPPVTLDGRDVPTTFDAEIDRQMADAKILDRKDVLRISFAGASMLYTTLDYQSGSSGKKRIAVFAISSKSIEGAVPIIRADGPFDRQLMDHYSGDIISIASAPAVALAGKLEIKPHPVAKKRAKTAAAPSKKSAKASPAKPRPDATPAPDNWSRKVYTDAVGYWPVTGPLAPATKTGFLNVHVYYPVSLGGKSLSDRLSAFTDTQEQYFNVQRREIAVMDGPNLAWDFLQSKNKHGVLLNVSYLAIGTGPDTMRIVREILTEKDSEDRVGYLRAIDRLYRTVETEVDPAFRSETSPATVMQIMTKTLQTESRQERRARQKRAKAAANAQRLSSVSSETGQGIPLDDIAGVFLRKDFLERAYGGKNATVAVYVLLKDGTAYRNPTRPPSNINVTASRRIEASKWTEWRKSGSDYQLREKAGAPWKTLKGKLAKPAPAKMIDFDGKHIAAWGDVLMGTAGHRTGTITLTRKGRFETSSFSLAGGSGITGLPAATVSTSTGKNGRQSTTLSNVAPALINNTKRDPNGTDFTGQYALKGYTAEFLSDSGKLNRALFLMVENGIYVNGRYYSPPDK